MGLGDLASLGQGFLQGAGTGLDMATRLKTLLLQEDAEKRRDASTGFTQKLQALGLVAKHPEYADQVPALFAGQEGAPTLSPEVVERAGQVREADLAINRFLLNPDREALHAAAAKNPHVVTRLRTNPEALKAYTTAAEMGRNQDALTGMNAEAERLVAAGMARPEAMRRAAGGDVRRLTLFEKGRHLVPPELSPADQAKQQAREQNAGDLRDMRLGVIPPGVAFERIMGRAAGSEYVRSVPEFQMGLHRAQATGRRVGEAEALAQPVGLGDVSEGVTGPTIAPPPPGLSFRVFPEAGPARAPVPAPAPRPGSAPAAGPGRRLPGRTVGDVLAGQRRAERGAGLSQEVLDQLQAAGLDPYQATPDQVGQAMAAADARARGRRTGGHLIDDQGNVLIYDAAGAAKPLLGPGGQPVKARAVAAGVIQYQDAAGQLVFGRVGADGTITPIQAPTGDQARPKPAKKSAVERAMDLAARASQGSRTAAPAPARPAPGRPAARAASAAPDPAALRSARDALVGALFPGRGWGQLNEEEKQRVADRLNGGP